MQTDFLEAAYRLRDLAGQALAADQPMQWLAHLEMAFTSAMAAGATAPVTCKLLSAAELPLALASPNHLIANVTRKGVVIEAALELTKQPESDLRRFPLIGALVSLIAKETEDVLRIVIDVGDGTDAGDYPRIAFSSARGDSLLVPDPYFYFNDNNAFYRAYVAQGAKPWARRRDIIFWRGGSGGRRLRKPDPAHPSDWSFQQRLALCQAARDSRHGERLDIALSHANTIGEDWLRQELARTGFVKPEVPKLEFFEYRYLVDVDGWTNAWSLLDKLIGGAAILKVASGFGYRQWFYDLLIPWRNYIPLAADLSDFDEIVDWVVAHPDACEELAANAARVSEEIQLMPDLALSAKAAPAISLI